MSRVERHSGFLIALDLDGTLLNARSRLTGRTVAALRQAARLGNTVLINTGRAWMAAREYYEQIGLASPIIVFNGACGLVPRGQGESGMDGLSTDGGFSLTVPADIVADLVRHQREFGIDLLVANTLTGMWADHFTTRWPVIIPADLPSSEVGRLDADHVPPDVIALNVAFDPSRGGRIRTLVAERYRGRIATRVWGVGTDTLQFIDGRAHKAYGLERMARLLGYPRSRVIAIGDDSNDIEMIDYAGRGVAMANGSEKLKAAADDVTDLSNAQDGVAQYLGSLLGFEVG